MGSTPTKGRGFDAQGWREQLEYNFDIWPVCPCLQVASTTTKSCWLRLLPWMLRDVAIRDQTTTVLGQKISLPVGFAPTAYLKMAHPDGEEGSAKAAKDAGTVMILSPMSNTSLEDVDSAAPGGLRWMQTFIFKERDVTRSLVLRAEKACYKAIVVGVDWPLSGRKIYDTKCGFDISPNLTNANFEGSDFASPKTAQGNSISKLKKALIDPSVVWGDVDWLRSITKLPIVVKGIIRPEDALTAVEHGASGIIVSNHGGRQLDGVAATIELLPDIIKAVNGRCEVYMDGGVRMGTDVTKAIAMGARAVFVSRPVVWGLAYNGQQGVAKMVSIFRDEIDRALGLLGCSSLKELTPDLVVRQEYYSRL
ncbi:2-Hydroxyacid oxidase 1-like isoform X2 [Dermacentor albipictus]|uniref:2-Hydroxyacid oxidase 1-like isoform X2 n=1 Tax=Dermacentor albipictus TaxID=60249 RepID=UPI0038FC4485